MANDQKAFRREQRMATIIALLRELEGDDIREILAEATRHFFLMECSRLTWEANRDRFKVVPTPPRRSGRPPRENPYKLNLRVVG